MLILFKKNNTKLISVIILFFVFAIFSLIIPKAQAEVWEVPQPQIDIPTVKLTEPAPCEDNGGSMCVPWIGEYISGIYQYAIGIVGVVAALVMMFAGVLWITAGGNASKIDDAKAWMGAALAGLVLALGSYTILYQVNPELVQIQPIKIKEAEKYESENLTFFNIEEIGTEISVTDDDGNSLPTSEIRQECLENCGGGEIIVQKVGDEYRCICESEVEEYCRAEGGTLVNSDRSCQERCGRNNYDFKMMPTSGSFCCTCNDNNGEGGSCGTGNGCTSGLYCYAGTCYSGDSGDNCGTDRCYQGSCTCQTGACIRNTCITNCEDCAGFFSSCSQEECMSISPDCVYDSNWFGNICQNP